MPILPEVAAYSPPSTPPIGNAQPRSVSSLMPVSLSRIWPRENSLRSRRWRVARLRPGQQRIKSGTQLLSPLRQAILHLRRHLMVDNPPDNAVVLQLRELLDQHLLRDRGYRPL